MEALYLTVNEVISALRLFYAPQFSNSAKTVSSWNWWAASRARFDIYGEHLWCWTGSQWIFFDALQCPGTSYEQNKDIIPPQTLPFSSQEPDFFERRSSLWTLASLNHRWSLLSLIFLACWPSDSVYSVISCPWGVCWPLICSRFLQHMYHILKTGTIEKHHYKTLAYDL